MSKGFARKGERVRSVFMGRTNKIPFVVAQVARRASSESRQAQMLSVATMTPTGLTSLIKKEAANVREFK